MKEKLRTQVLTLVNQKMEKMTLIFHTHYELVYWVDGWCIILRLLSFIACIPICSNYICNRNCGHRVERQRHLGSNFWHFTNWMLSAISPATRPPQSPFLFPASVTNELWWEVHKTLHFQLIYIAKFEYISKLLSQIVNPRAWMSCEYACESQIDLSLWSIACVMWPHLNSSFNFTLS